jgi:hypothetical protein
MPLIIYTVYSAIQNNKNLGQIFTGAMQDTVARNLSKTAKSARNHSKYINLKISETVTN